MSGFSLGFPCSGAALAAAPPRRHHALVLSIKIWKPEKIDAWNIYSLRRWNNHCNRHYTSPLNNSQQVFTVIFERTLACRIPRARPRQARPKRKWPRRHRSRPSPKRPIQRHRRRRNTLVGRSTQSLSWLNADIRRGDRHADAPDRHIYAPIQFNRLPGPTTRGPILCGS